MRLRHVEGFDFCDYPGSVLKYTYNKNVSFNQGQMLPGRADGQSWWIFNTASSQAEYLKTLDSQGVWCVQFDYRPLINSTGANPQTWRDVEFLRMQWASGTVLSLRQNPNGTVDLRQGTGGTAPVLANSVITFPVGGDWHNFRLLFKTGPSGNFTWMVDDSVIATQSLNLGANAVDRFNLRWDNAGGLNVDNYCIWDGGDGDATIPPQVRVSSLFCDVLGASAGWTVPVGPSILRALGDRPGVIPSYSEFPDGELGYVQPASPAQVLTFLCSKPVCYGRVLGVALNVCAAPISGLQQIEMILRQGATETQIKPLTNLDDSGSLLTFRTELNGYRTYQGIQQLDPVMGVTWLDRGVAAAQWGIRNGPQAPNLRVTAMFLEKVVSLDPAMSFSCGPANYGYAS